VRKPILLTEELSKVLRERAHRKRRSEGEIVPDAVAAWLFPDDEAPT